MKNNPIVHEIQNELQSIVKSIQQLADHVAAMAIVFAELTQVAPTKARPAKRAPVRKKVVVKDGVVEKIKRIPATQIVYNIILKSKLGINTSALMEATGFNQRKIHNITFRLKSQNRIKSVGRGLYKTV